VGVSAIRNVPTVRISIPTAIRCPNCIGENSFGEFMPACYYFLGSFISGIVPPRPTNPLTIQSLVTTEPVITLPIRHSDVVKPKNDLIT
jgi:hypothetical protein